MTLFELKEHINGLIKKGYGDKEIIRLARNDMGEIEYNKTYDKIFL